MCQTFRIIMYTCKYLCILCLSWVMLSKIRARPFGDPMRWRHPIHVSSSLTDSWQVDWGNFCVVTPAWHTNPACITVCIKANAGFRCSGGSEGIVCWQLIVFMTRYFSWLSVCIVLFWWTVIVYYGNMLLFWKVYIRGVVAYVIFIECTVLVMFKYRAYNISIIGIKNLTLIATIYLI